MKTLVVIIFALFFFINSNAQNLVLNPGFDNYISCPGFGQFNSTYIPAWDKPTIASSDYYHFNCPGIQPLQQFPKSGEGYAGIIAYNYGTEYREYITGTFSSPLTAGTIYSISFYVSLNDGYIQAITEMGAYISNAAPGPFPNALHINVIPQIENTGVSLEDTAVWKKVSGLYTASGGEQYITIGNFHDDLTTSITQPGSVGSYGAYYFIEDVSVTVDSTTAIPDENITAANVYVNNNTLFITAVTENTLQKVAVYDLMGKLMLSAKNVASHITLDLSNFSREIYIIRIQTDQGIYSRKILLSRHSGTN
jgi:hypothetical protein